MDTWKGRHAVIPVGREGQRRRKAQRFILQRCIGYSRTRTRARTLEPGRLKPVLGQTCATGRSRTTRTYFNSAADVLACTLTLYAFSESHWSVLSFLLEQQYVLWSWIHHGDTSGHGIHDSADTMVVNDGVCASHSTSCFQRPPVMYMRSGGAGGSRRVTACILLVLLELAPTYLD